MPILPLIVGATFAAAPMAPPPTFQAPGHVVSAPERYPALWVVNDNDTIIYLFGTFHTLDERSTWFGQAVKTAFTASDQLMLETLVPKPGSHDRPVGNLSPDSGQPTAPVAQLTPTASYLASTKMVMNAGRSRGLSTAHGADAVLRDTAELAGKPVGGLESFEFQMSMFRSLPRSAHPAPPPQDPQSVRAMGSMLSTLKDAWGRGDLDRFAPVLIQMREQSPQLYRTMFAERNARWAQWIANRLNSPGTVFVAVGAGHLSGPDSVQHQLAGIGVKSARVN